MSARSSLALAITLVLGCKPEPELVIVGVRELGPITTADGVGLRERGTSVYGFNARSVWLFGATEFEPPDLAGLTARPNSYAHTIDSTAVDGLDLFVTPIDAADGPAELFGLTADELAFNQANPETPVVLAPLTAVRDDQNDQILVLYEKLQASATGELTPIGSSLAVWTELEFGPIRPVLDAGSDEPTLLFHAPEPAFGQAALIVDDRLYAFACDEAIYHPCRLARVEIDAVFERDAWEFWTGITWSPDSTDAVALVEADTSLTVAYNTEVGRFLGFYGGRETGDLWVRAAERLEGPWSDPIHVFTAEAAVADVAAHPEYRRGAGHFEYLSYRVGAELRLLEVELSGHP